MSRNLVNVAAFQACWWATILSAGAGRPWIAAASSAAFLAFHLGGFERSPAEARLVAAAFLVGSALETLNALLGVTRFDPPPLGLPLAPAWILLQWAVFGCLLRHSLGWLRGRYALAAVLGAVAAPPSYYGGERLGALSLGGRPALIAVGLEYAAAIPLLLLVERRLSLRSGGRPTASAPGTAAPGP